MLSFLLYLNIIFVFLHLTLDFMLPDVSFSDLLNL